MKIWLQLFLSFLAISLSPRSGLGTEKPVVKIAIVGSGISSLSFAYALMQKDSDRVLYDVTIFERSSRVGGRSESSRVALDRGTSVTTNWGTQMNFEQFFQLESEYPELRKLGLMKMLQPSVQNISVLATDTDGEMRIIPLPRVEDADDQSELSEKSKQVAATKILPKEELILGALAIKSIRDTHLGGLSFFDIESYIENPSLRELDAISARVFLDNYRHPLRATFREEDLFSPRAVFGAWAKVFEYATTGSGKRKGELAEEALENWIVSRGYNSAYFTQGYIDKMISSFESIVEFTDLESMSALNFLWQLKWILEGGKIVVASNGWDRLSEKFHEELTKKSPIKGKHHFQFHMNQEVLNIAASPSGRLQIFARSTISETPSTTTKDSKEFDFVFNTSDLDDTQRQSQSLWRSEDTPLTESFKDMVQSNAYSSTIVMKWITHLPIQTLLGQITPALAPSPGIFQSIGGITFDSGLKNQNLGDREIVSVFLNAKIATQLLNAAKAQNWNQEQLTQQATTVVMEDLERAGAALSLLKDLKSSLETGQLIGLKPYPKALPLFGPGHLTNVSNYLDEVRTSWKHFSTPETQTAQVLHPTSRLIAMGQSLFGRSVVTSVAGSMKLANQFSEQIESAAARDSRKNSSAQTCNQALGNPKH